MDKTGRGWNDPPNLPVGFQSPVSTTKRSGISLNKRVPFPISGPIPTATESGNEAMLLPPKVQVAVPDAPPLASKNSVQEPPSELPGSDTAEPNLEDVTSNIDKILEDANDIEHKADIIRKLEEMKKMWTDGLLDKKLSEKVINISKALLDKNVELASSLQVEITAGWPSESNKWAAALRCLINYLRLSSSLNAEVSPSNLDGDEKPECDQIN